MDLKFSKVDRKGPVTIVTLSRPEVYNALHTDAHFELNRVFNDFAADPEQWVAIVTGAGDKAFCAGNDLKWQAAGGKRGWDTGGFAGLTSRFDCDKPIIAAVNGVAMGGGFEIALACDLIVAAENARFALPEPRVGLAALAGGLHRLPRQIGLKHAMGMMKLMRQAADELGKTVVLVLHDINFASWYSDHIVAMKQGKVAAQGTVKEIIRPEVLNPIYEMDINVHEIGGQLISVYYG